MHKDLKIEAELNRLASNSSALLEKQDYESSILISQKALKLAIRHYGESNSITGSLYSFIGTSYSNKGDFDRGLEYLFKSMNIFLLLKGNVSIELASVYNNIASLLWRKASDFYNNNYKDKNDIKSSILYFRRSLKIYVKLFGISNKRVAILYNNLGFIYNENRRVKAAYKCFSLSNKIYLNLFGKNSIEAASSFHNLGIFYYSDKKFNKSIKFLTISINILSKLKDQNILLSQRYKMLALTYLQLNKYYRSLQLIEKAISLYLSHFNFSDSESVQSIPQYKYLDFLRIKASVVWYIYINKSRNLKDLKKADKEYFFLIQLLDRIRKDYFHVSSRNNLSAKTVSIFEKAIEVSLELYKIYHEEKYLDSAYSYSQKSKSISLMENITDYNAKVSSNIPSAILKKENNLKKKISDFEKLIYAKSKNPGRSESEINEMRNNLFILKHRFETFIKSLENKYPEYYTLKNDLRTVTANEIKKYIQNDTMIIEYFLGEENIFAFVFTKETCFVNQIKKSRSFEKKIREYRDLLTQFNSFMQSNFAVRFKNLSHYFYKVLLKNILNEHISFSDKDSGKKIQCKNILIVPDNELNFIPFDSLITSDFDERTEFKDLPYLIKYFNIIFSYSIILYLKYSIEKDKRNKLNILAFAPVFKDKYKKRITNPADNFRDSLSPLNFNLKEVKDISKNFAGKYYLDREAIKENFIKNKKRFSVLHLATHSVLDDENPLYSKIVFSKSLEKKDEGFLHTYEIYTLNSRYDMVVLSACNTGFGRMVRGEGIMSIARAFAASGSKNIVMSLWQVNDKSTSEIMKLFYGYLSKGEKVGEALRNAKLMYLKKSAGLRSLPFYWSSFISYGVNNSLI